MDTKSIKEKSFILIAIAGSVAGVLVSLIAMVHRTLSGIEDPSFSTMGLPVTLAISALTGASIAVLIACAICAVIVAIQYVTNNHKN